VFLVILVSIAIAFVLIFLMGRVPAADAQAAAHTGTSPIDAEKFEALCVALLGKLGIEIRRTTRIRPGEVDFVGRNAADVTGGEYIVQCIFSTDGRPLEPSRVVSLSDGVRAERALKGMIITTGRFAPEVFKLADLAPLALIDGREFRQLLERHAIAPAVSGANP